MKEKSILKVNCTECRNLLNAAKGCKLYGTDPGQAVKACARDGFKNAPAQPERIERDKEFYFRVDFRCPVCRNHLASYTFGRSYTDEGLSNDKRVDCIVCGQNIDWSGIPFPDEEG